MLLGCSSSSHSTRRWFCKPLLSGLAVWLSGGALAKQQELSVGLKRNLKKGIGLESQCRCHNHSLWVFHSQWMGRKHISLLD